MIGSHLIVLALFSFSFQAANSQTQGIPHGGGTCDPSLNAWDCSLGGVCNATKQCACDPWFTGPQCDLLNLQAPEDDQAGTCGRTFDSYHSWGGRPIYNAADNKWHSVLSFMCLHKTLDSWTTASSSAHFISDSPAGVYEWSPEQCVGEICTPTIIPWSHNTVFVRDEKEKERVGGQTGAEWQIWHVGDGVAPPSGWSPCFNRSEVHQRFSILDASRTNAGGGGNGVLTKLPTTPSPGNAAYVSYSDSPNGPFTRALNNGQIPINFTGSWTTALAGNPAPLVMPDGSINLYFTAVPCPKNSGALAPNCIAMATSTTGFEGPYQMNAAPHPIFYPESEDPSAFIDPRGNVHSLTNCNTFHARCAQGVQCGGHAWSRDGKVFSNLTIGAFGPAITFRNGTVWKNAYVERPLVSLGVDGTPISLSLGMGRTGYADSCNWPQLFCTGAPGEVCGPTLTPVPPPPPPPVSYRLKNGDACLSVYNYTAYPCSGSGPSGGCPVVMGPCSTNNPSSIWNLTLVHGSSTITSAAIPGAGLDVDCDSTAPNTIVKALNSGIFVFSLGGGDTRIQMPGGGGCLNSGQGLPNKPCGNHPEVYLPQQIKVTPCSDPTALGWVLEAV